MNISVFIFSFIAIIVQSQYHGFISAGFVPLGKTDFQKSGQFLFRSYSES